MPPGKPHTLASDEGEIKTPAGRISRSTQRPVIEPTGLKASQDEFDWASLVALTLHPAKVVIIEALEWIGEPLSATELAHMTASQHKLDMIIYHAGILAKLGVLDRTHTRQVRGAREHFYSLRR